MKKNKFLSVIIILNIILGISLRGVIYASNQQSNNVEVNENTNSISEINENMEEDEAVEITEENEDNEVIENKETFEENTENNTLGLQLEQNNIEQIIENGTYIISSAMKSNLVLDVAENSSNSGANVAIWERNNQNNQKFNITYLGDGYYKMEVVSSGKYLSGATKNAKKEDNVIQSTYNDLDTQKWFIKEAGDGYYYIISKDNSLYLDITGAKQQLGTNVGLYVSNSGANQKFKFNKINVIKGEQTIKEGTYNISSELNFNLVLDVHGASKSNSANVELYTRNNDANQKFEFKITDDGYYKIKAVHSGKVLTVKNASISPESNVEQQEDLNLDSQKWVVKSAGNGYYYIISKCNGLYLDLQGGSAKSGANLDVYGANYKSWQKFKFYNVEIEAKKTIDSGNYVITSALNTNRVIDIAGNVASNNANVEIWQNNNGNNQKFVINYLQDGYYTIKAFNSNKVLTVQNNLAVNGANVVQEFYKGTDNQKWAIISEGNGYYSFVSKSSGLALDIHGASSQNGTNVEIYEINGQNNQKFKFVETEFSSTIANGKYAILASSNVKKSIDIEWGSTNEDANVELWESNGGNNQSFYIEYVGNGYYTIQALCSRKLLTLQGTNIVQKEDKNLDTQKWVIAQADSNGNYSFRCKSNDYYLDIYNNNMTNGTNIEIYPGNDEYSQKFKLEELVYNGIDVSKYQKDIEWNKVKTQIDFAMIRVGYRGYGSGKIVEDDYYSKNIEGALSNGINCGVYFFSQAINEKEGIEEANWVLEKIKGYQIKYPIAIDTEWSSGNKNGRADWISKEDRTSAIIGFCKTIKNAGYTPIIYTNKDWSQNQLNMNSLSEYDVWLAHYVVGAPYVKSDYQGKYSIWQYTSSGTINGISTLVDMNICYKKYN